MPYATVQSMTDRFGETEIIRLSRPEDREATTLLAAKVELAIADASALIDDYARKHYRVPIAAPPDSIVRATCVLARYDLAKGERTEPTEQMRLDRKEVIAWLEDIAAGKVKLDAPAVSTPGSGGASGARVSDRPGAFSDKSLGGW